MTTEQKFNCIFCKDVFDSKEELQVHFRKHADPTFNSKNRFEMDSLKSQTSTEKVKEKADLVSCDVCTQMFPTISKAITHKHKVHPDHDVKYFCPWCGKLFTMKHPYNIHIQTTHEKQEQIENKIFHCDCCDVDFFLPSAMIYHNKFFHRQDTDIPEVGTSKKLRMYNQEVLLLYYCAFCGEEYENKVNLFKHVTDDHGDENQCPEEVLRCPLCEAIFYHLDAYEIHLSFHNTEDLYSANNELFADLMDFSLETVPPMIEKVEARDELEAEAQSQEADVESNVNAVGIEKFLELAMDQTEDSNPGKVKKKKHKKSKKSAITLDEFLSMNQDVFGEGLDFQGVEEVPTRVVKKQFKSNKKATNAAAAAELEKLKQKGIVVMKVAANKPAKTAVKTAQRKVVNKATPNRELKTSSEVLTKLINQSNNQIKIVKKTVPSVNKNDSGQSTQNAPTEMNKAPDQNVADNEMQTMNEGKEDSEIVNKSEKTSLDIHSDSFSSKDKETNLRPPKSEDNVSPATPVNTMPSTSDNSNEKPLLEDNNLDKESNGNHNEEESSEVALPSSSPKITDNKDENVASHNFTINNKQVMDISGQEENYSATNDRDNITDTEENQNTDEHNENIEVPKSDKIITPPSISPVISSLSTLKHLSNLTVKPVNQNKNILSELTTDKTSKVDNSPKPDVDDEEVPSQALADTDKDNDTNPNNTKPLVENDPTLDALKNLSKNITIKSLSSSLKRNIDECNDDKESETTPQCPATNIAKEVTGNKNLTIKKIKTDNNEPVVNNKVINAVNNAIKNTKIINKVSPTPDHKPNKSNTDSAQNSPMKNTDILKHLPNITTKALPAKKKVQSLGVKESDSAHKSETSHKEGEIIEISDIDDSEDDTDDKEPECKQDAPNPVDPFKNLSKHITVKSLNQPVQILKKNIKVEEPDEQDNDEDHIPTCNSDDIPRDIPKNIKVCSQKLSNRNAAFQNALKSLGKNITLKSRTSSPCRSVKSQDQNSQDSNMGFNEEASDSEMEIGKVKITEMDDDSNHEEVHDEEIDNCEPEPNYNDPIVESPHDSDNEDLPEKDLEEELKATSVQKMSHEVTTNKNAFCLNNLKNISKSITVKSLNSNVIEKQEVAIPAQSQESLEVAKSQPMPMSVKFAQQLARESSNDNPAKSRNVNVKKLGKIVDHTAKQSLNQKVSVNKEVTVKTFQTKTIIQEITTTVTKTIKTVNQTVQQEMRNSSQINIPVLPQKVQGMTPSTSKNLQGVVIRHAPPGAAKQNNTVAQARPAGNVPPVRPACNVAQVRPAANVAPVRPAANVAPVRPSKQVVPVRPGLNANRPSAPRMPGVKTSLPKSSPNKPVIGKPLKFSPSVLTTNQTPKRANNEDATGPFSCFKKPKESLIPVSDIPNLAASGESVVQVNAASHTSTSNYSSTSKIVKGNSVVTATQMKSEVTSMQHYSRINNSVGTKVKCAQVKQIQMQEKSESSGMKRTTLEAIEKLQKQGLLIKKPRIEEADETYDDSEQVDNNVGYTSADEHDE